MQGVGRSLVVLLSVFVLSLLLCHQLVSAGEDYYQLMGLQRSATDQQIAKAYKQLARKWHPDKHPPEDRAKAQETFQKISQGTSFLFYFFLLFNVRNSKYFFPFSLDFYLFNGYTF